jgi:hypothetical protein
MSVTIAVRFDLVLSIDVGAVGTAGVAYFWEIKADNESLKDKGRA